MHACTASQLFRFWTLAGRAPTASPQICLIKASEGYKDRSTGSRVDLADDTLDMLEGISRRIIGRPLYALRVDDE
jgi:hypothetical protein